jgi:hypothetical protein
MHHDTASAAYLNHSLERIGTQHSVRAVLLPDGGATDTAAEAYAHQRSVGGERYRTATQRHASSSAAQPQHSTQPSCMHKDGSEQRHSEVRTETWRPQ